GPLAGEGLRYAAVRVGGWWMGRRRLAEYRTYLDPADLTAAGAELDAQFARPLWRTFVVEQRALVHQLGLLDGALSTVESPVRVVAGTEDPIIPRRTVQAIQRRGPAAAGGWGGGGRPGPPPRPPRPPGGAPRARPAPRPPPPPPPPA